MRSDNIYGVSEPIMKAMVAANRGTQSSYGSDDLTEHMEEKLREVFEKPDLKAYCVVTGTAANSLALATITPPYGAVLCHESAHVELDECGAPEFYTGGAKLTTLRGEGARLRASDLKVLFDQSEKGFVHAAQISAVSLSQTTELGTVYGLSEIEEIAALTHDNDCRLHMDGARFTNALVSLGCSAADMTWKAGVDVVSFGATKNGAMAAECVIFFDPDLAQDFEYRRKRGGHLISKMRFVSAQMLAYLENDHWLDNARHANAMAQRMENGIAQVEGLEISFPVQSNMVFMKMPETLDKILRNAGFPFYYFLAEGEKYARFVTSFSNSEEEIDQLLQVIKNWAS